MSKLNMILNMVSLQRNLLLRAARVGVRNISISNALRKSHYETLGVPRNASQAEIKNAYFELSKLYHPDRIAATDENLAKFREVSAAYEILGNEHSRRLYDKGLLGDTAKLEEEELKDPIIKFYKQRQDVTKQQAKVGDDLDAWARTYFAEAKKKAAKQHDLYTGSVKEDADPESPIFKYSFQLTLATAILFAFSTNFEDSTADQLCKKITSCCGC